MKQDACRDIGSERQLFVDELLIEALSDASLRLHEPVHRENVLYLDRPWEGEESWCPIVMRDGDRYRMWYRGGGDGGPGQQSFTCYAESQDGVEWHRPSLGIHEFGGSKDNNICISTPDANNVAVFRDEQPGVPDAERYKAAGRWGGGSPSRIYGLVSPDGVRWEMAPDGPLIVAPEDDPHFDSPVGAFWDPAAEHYAIYARGWEPPGRTRIRAIRRSISKDFTDWSPWEYITINSGETWEHHLYTNSGHPYYRAPYYLMFPKRFVTDRTRFAEWPYPGQSDVILLASRDGLRFTQLFKEAFLRPGLDSKNWHERSIFIGACVVQTAPGEMSMYSVQNYRTASLHFRRLTLREDGFVSVNAPYRGGELLTKPFTFQGSKLELNYSTSAVGSVRVEIQRPDGVAAEGFALDACEEIFGDEIERAVAWQGRTNVSAVCDEPVRLRFVMSDADLYAFQFCE